MLMRLPDDDISTVENSLVDESNKILHWHLNQLNHLNQ